MRKSMKKTIPIVLTAIVLLAAVSSMAKEPTGVPADKLSAAYGNDTYSPYTNHNYPMRPMWGDTHVHTSTM